MVYIPELGHNGPITRALSVDGRGTRHNSGGICMNIRKFVVALGLAIIALPASAQSVAGKWDLAMEGMGNLATFDFTVEGDVLKGTSTSAMDGSTTTIDEGKIEGNKLTWKQTVDAGAGPVTIGYTGVLEGDKIALTIDLGELAAAAGGAEMPPMSLTRAPTQ